MRSRKPGPKRPAGPKPATPKAPAGRAQLSLEQTLGVQLMSARQAIKAKNVFIAESQLARATAAQADAKRIQELELELAAQTNQLMGALNRAEDAENHLLHQRLGLPEGEVAYSMGADGLYSYEVKAPKPALMPPLMPAADPKVAAPDTPDPA